jgi:hypothetical protein
MSEMLPLDPQEVSPIFQGYAIDRIGEFKCLVSTAVTPDSASSVTSPSTNLHDGAANDFPDAFETPVAAQNKPIVAFEHCSHMKFSGCFTMLVKKAPSVDIAEHFVLFFEDQLPNVNPENITVYGEGTNLYGKFVLTGTFNKNTSQLSCRKKYVPSKRHRKRTGSGGHEQFVPAVAMGSSSSSTGSAGSQPRASKRSRKASTINKDLGAEHFNQKPRDLGVGLDGIALGFDINVMIPSPMGATHSHSSPAPSSTRSAGSGSGSGSHRKRGRPRHDASPSNYNPYTPEVYQEQPPVPQWHGAHKDDKRQTYEGDYVDGTVHCRL